MTTLLKKKNARSGLAIWYRVRADLRGRRLPAGSVVLVVALATMLIGLALAVSASAQAPFDRLFTQLNGAHLWIYFPSPSAPTQGQLDAVIHAPNVASSTELEEGIRADALIASQKVGADVQTFPEHQPAIGQLLILQGHGLASDDPGGVVVNKPFVDAQHLQVGGALTLVTPNGPTRIHIRGLSVDVNQVSRDEATQATIYMLRPTFERLYPQPDRWIVGMRLVDPYAIDQTTGSILQRLHAQGYPQKEGLWTNDWLYERATVDSSSQLTVILLLIFGIVGLVAAGVIVANLVIGQVLAQQRDLGILKAVGFTPRQLVRTLVLEYLLLGLLGATLGLILMMPITSPLLTAIGSSLGVPVLPQYNLTTAALLVLAVLLVVAVCAALPAWRAGRTRIVDAIRPGGTVPKHGRARLVGLMFTTGLPVVLALGIRGITTRLLSTVLVSLTLLVGVLTAVFGLGLGATLNRYAHDPALNGIFADVYVTPGLYQPAATQPLLSSRPEVAYYYSTFQSPAQLSDGGILSMLFTSGDPRRVAASVSGGRWFNPHANELVLSHYALQRLGLHLGEQIPLIVNVRLGLQFTTEVPITYTVVGTLYMTQQPLQAYAPLSSLTTATAVTSDKLLANTGYEVTLRSGVSPQTFEQRLDALSADRLGIKIYDLKLPPGVAQGPMIMLFLSIVLMIVAAVGILNAMTLSTRERYRELASLKAVGLTPRQVLGSVINGALSLGILAVLIGIPLGLWLNTVLAQGIASGVGGPPNIQISINWLGLILLIPATLCIAALGAYVPARWAARIPAAEVLRYE
jgi:putative ABC transport system permease protein